MTERRPVGQRWETDAASIRHDLGRLVLTIVELLRQLMERQALRRVESGTLSDSQVEELGVALMRLEQAMTELREHFDLEPGDLNLDLGPLLNLDLAPNQLKSH
ncbi:MAG: gas vesicle protein K [Pseudonocardiales bacterium]